MTTCDLLLITCGAAVLAFAIGCIFTNVNMGWNKTFRSIKLEIALPAVAVCAFIVAMSLNSFLTKNVKVVACKDKPSTATIGMSCLKGELYGLGRH